MNEKGLLAAPVYWANVPASVKNLFDRLLGMAGKKELLKQTIKKIERCMK